jgi:hypothetical protein
MWRGTTKRCFRAGRGAERPAGVNAEQEEVVGLKTIRDIVATAFLLIGTPTRASAHADYEGVETTLTDARGRAFTVVRHYTDGIVMSDPVKLIVRDPDGKTVAETPYTRGVVMYRAADGTLYAFAVDLHDHTFWRGWVVEPGGLAEVSVTPGIVLTALWAHLSGYWPGYAFTAMVCWMAAWAYARRVRRQRTWRADPGWPAVVAVGWLGLALMYTGLSMVLVVGLAAVTTVPFAWWARRGREPLAARTAGAAVPPRVP